MPFLRDQVVTIGGSPHTSFAPRLLLRVICTAIGILANHSVTEGDVIAFREVGGLHHRYERRVA